MRRSRRGRVDPSSDNSKHGNGIGDRIGRVGTRPSTADDVTKVKGKLEGLTDGMEDTALANAHRKVDSNDRTNTLIDTLSEPETMRRNARLLTNMDTRMDRK